MTGIDLELRVRVESKAVTYDNAIWREVGDGLPDTDAKERLVVAEMAFTN